MRMYVESDGRIFLVNRAGRLELPEAHEVPFGVERVAPLACNEDVWYCSPYLDHHPHEWHAKDDLPAAPSVSPLVRAAVHATMPRIVVEGLCIRDKRVLLVKGSRGLTEGRWTLPGGFLRFGETPEQGVLREIQEEVGVTGTVERFVGVRSKLGSRSRLHWTILFYRVATDETPRPNPDEIAEARFVTMDQAASMLLDETMIAVLRESE
jgi:ADP-ribose pyrophosphatase YjhB (NUDIX family)